MQDEPSPDNIPEANEIIETYADQSQVVQPYPSAIINTSDTLIPNLPNMEVHHHPVTIAKRKSNKNHWLFTRRIPFSING